MKGRRFFILSSNLCVHVEEFIIPHAALSPVASTVTVLACLMTGITVIYMTVRYAWQPPPLGKPRQSQSYGKLSIYMDDKNP